MASVELHAATPFLRADVQVTPTEPAKPPRVPFMTGLLLLIPEAWLDRWGPRINTGVCVLIVAYCLAWIGLTAAGVLHRLGPLTATEVELIAFAWVPLMGANMILVGARMAHLHAWLHEQRDRIAMADQGLMQAIGGAVHDAMTRALMGADAATQEAEGPTIQ